MLERIFPAKVIDKTKEESGWLFKTTKYYVVVKVDGLSKKVQKRRVSMEQFYDYRIGDSIDLHLYSINGEYWYFSREEAEDGHY